jgi:hypothetical protein
LGIASIDLDAAPENEDSNGNTILAYGSFTWADGKTGDIAGVNLLYSPEATRERSARSNSVAGNSLDSLISSMAAFAPPASGEGTPAGVGESRRYNHPLLAAAH